MPDIKSLLSSAPVSPAPRTVLAAMGLLALAAFVTPATAQGVVVSVPVGTPQGQTAPAEAAPPKAAKSKPSASSAAAAKKSSAPPSKTASLQTGEKGKPSQTIVALVNDEPISGYDLDQRINFMVLSGAGIAERMQARMRAPDINDRFKAFATKRIQERQPKSQAEFEAMKTQLQKEFVDGMRHQVMSEVRPALRKAALEELIDEMLKLQDGKKYNVVVSDEDVSKQVKNLAEKNGKTEAQFVQMVASQGVDIVTMRARFKASMIWAQIIRGKYGQVVNTTDRDVDRILASSKAQIASEQTELQLQKITLSLPAKPDQKSMSQKLDAAEAIRKQFANCASMSSLAKSGTDAKFENLGNRKASSIAEPTRGLLLNASDGEMIPPQLAKGGVELYAVCGRTQVKADDQRRAAVKEELQQTEFDTRARKHLQDLRQDALIEYR